jgi:hypothetical protein
MSLPKISHPTFEVDIPSLKKKTKMRLMLVKEEKILLMAKESESAADVMNAIKQVVNNCLVDTSIDVDKLALFDIEYLFLKLRSASIDNITNVSYRDNEDGEVYKFDIDLSKVEIKFPENIDDVVVVNDKIKIALKYPNASIFNDKTIIDDNDEFFQMIVLNSIDKIFEGDNAIKLDNYKREEIDEFMESLPIQSFQKIRDFISNAPKLFYEIKYKNNLNNDRSIILNNLNDFFTLR